MKPKILSGIIYATTALALAQFFDALYAGEPVTDHLGLNHLAIAGTILFAAACILSIFNLQAGVICGLAGAILSWPGFAFVMPTIPWGSFVSSFRYSNWGFLLTAILALVVSSAYSLNQLRVWRRGGNDVKECNLGFKIAAALFYAAGIFVVSNWSSIWDWFYKLRYSN